MPIIVIMLLHVGEKKNEESQQHFAIESNASHYVLFSKSVATSAS